MRTLKEKVKGYMSNLAKEEAQDKEKSDYCNCFQPPPHTRNFLADKNAHLIAH